MDSVLHILGLVTSVGCVLLAFGLARGAKKRDAIEERIDELEEKMTSCREHHDSRYVRTSDWKDTLKDLKDSIKDLYDLQRKSPTKDDMNRVENLLKAVLAGQRGGPP